MNRPEKITISKSIWNPLAAAVLMAAVFSSHPAHAAEQVISSIKVNLSAEGTARTSVDQIKKVIPMHEGDIFSLKKLDEALDCLRKWGIFESINAGTAQTTAGIEIAFFLKEAVLIGEIDTYGNYPYVERKIKKYLTIKPGDMYTRERVDEQIQKIKDFYEREGFLNTDVTAKERWNEFSEDVSVSFRIRRGTVLRYGDIRIEGMKAYPKGRLISAINPLKRYIPRKFNDAIRETEDFYHRHGWPRAQITVKERRIDVERGRIEISLNVFEGPHVDVSFIGNRHISSGRLKKAATIFDEGSFDDYEIEASRDAIKSLYRRNGFDSVEVNAERKMLKSGNALITFRIKEGARKKVLKIGIDGNKIIPARSIKKQMRTKPPSFSSRGIFNEDVLKSDMENIRKYYEREGFLEAEVGNPSVAEERGGIAITIPVDEDGRTFVKKILFAGNSSFSDGTLAKRLKNRAGRPFNPSLLEDDSRAISVFYADHGYPYAAVKYSVESDSKSTVIRYDIEEGGLVRIGEVLIVGNSLTAAGSIKKSISIREGDSYSYQKIVDSQLGLRRMGAFNSVTIKVIGLEEGEEVVHLLISVEEQKPFMLDFELGYSTDQLLTGSAMFTNFNTFGMAKRTNLTLTGGRKLSRAEANWIDPRFFGSDFEMTTSAWFQYQDKDVFNYLQAGGGFGFFRRYHRTGMLAKYELMRNYFIKGDSTAADADSLRDNTISKISLSASFDTRNSFSDPTRGIYTAAFTDMYNEIRGKQANFAKLQWGMAQYLGFLKQFVLSNMLRFGRIETIGRNISVPSNELFLMGGDDTVRGFPQGSLGPVNAAGKATGGRTRIIYNGELNIKVYGNWKVAGFYDTGVLVNNFSDIDLETIRQSAGFGLRYVTPVGPMRFDYGIVLDRKEGEDFGRFHFTFGFLF